MWRTVIASLRSLLVRKQNTIEGPKEGRGLWPPPKPRRRPGFAVLPRPLPQRDEAPQSGPNRGVAITNTCGLEWPKTRRPPVFGLTDQHAGAGRWSALVKYGGEGKRFQR